jgi:solute carrier family 24 (sodium/potassium/calcium exchanger), member 6
MLLAILSDHLIHAWEAQLLIGLYAIYVATVVSASWWERRQEKRRRTEAVVRSEFEPEGTPTPPEFEEPYRDVREYHYWVCVFRRGLISPKPVLHHHLIRLLRHHRRVRAISSPGPQRLGIETHDLPMQPHSQTPLPSPPPPHRLSHMPSLSILVKTVVADSVVIK